MRTALIEWAIVVDALGRGAQSLIIRKGGIHEGPAGFLFKHDRFLLLPTWHHQQREDVVPAVPEQFDVISGRFGSPSIVRLEFFAEAVAAEKTARVEVIRRLRRQHIWRDEVVAGRFQWGRKIEP